MKMDNEYLPLIHSRPAVVHTRGWKTFTIMFVVALSVAAVVYANRLEHRDRLTLSHQRMVEGGVGTSEIRKEKGPCAGGYVMNSQRRCEPCHPGTYKPKNQDLCLPCPQDGPNPCRTLQVAALPDSLSLSSHSNPVRGDMPGFICIQGLPVGGDMGFDKNGKYELDPDAMWGEPEPIWVRLPMEIFMNDGDFQIALKESGAFWKLEQSFHGPNPSLDLMRFPRSPNSDDPTHDGNNPTIELWDPNTNQWVANAGGAAMFIRESCIAGPERMCIKNVHLSRGSWINGEWESTEIGEWTREYQRLPSPDVAEPGPFTLKVNPTEKNGAFYEFTYETSSAIHEFAKFPFKNGNVMINLIETGIQAAKFEAPAGSFTVEEGPCPAVNLESDICEYAVLQMAASQTYLDTMYPYDADEVRLEVDYLTWFYEMYAFNDIVRNFHSDFVDIQVNVMDELEQIASNTAWTNTVDPLEKIRSTYNKLLDAHTSYTPHADRRVVTWTQPVITMALATHENKFAVFGKTTKTIVDLYKKEFGDASWTWGEADDSSTEWWKIIEINGLDALAALKIYAVDNFGSYHDPATRVERMLQMAAFSARTVRPESDTLTWKVCKPGDCTNTEIDLEIHWIAIVKLKCDPLPTGNPTTTSPTKRPTQNPTQTQIPPVVVAGVPTDHPTESPTTSIPTRSPTSVRGVPCEINYNDEASLGTDRGDALSLDEETINEMRMGVEDFTGKRSSLRDTHSVVSFQHVNLAKIASKRRVMPLEYATLSRPIDLMSETHQDRMLDDKLPSHVASDVVYIESGVMSYLKLGHEFVLHIPTFNNLDHARFRADFHANMRRMAVDAQMTKLVIDFTGNSGGNICLGYGMLSYLIRDVGFDRIIASAPYDMAADTKLKAMGVIISDKIREYETRGECPQNPCDHLGFFAPCKWGFTDATWITEGDNNIQRVDGQSQDLSKRLSWATVCHKEKIEWQKLTPPNVPILDKNNLLLISDGSCGSMCAVVSSFLHANGYAELATYGGFWTNQPDSAPTSVTQIFNAFPGGSVIDGRTVIRHLLMNGRLDWETNDVRSIMTPLANHEGQWMRGKHRFTMTEIFNPILDDETPFTHIGPLEFLDSTRLARFRVPVALMTVQTKKVQETAVEQLVAIWRESTNPAPPTVSVRRRLIRSQEAIAGANLAHPGKLSCDDGYFWDDQGECEACPPGSYCVHGLLQKCRLGWYQKSVGQSKCDEAPCGMFVCVNGAREPLQCPDGTYQPLTGRTKCLQVPSGFTPSLGACHVTVDRRSELNHLLGRDTW